MLKSLAIFVLLLGLSGCASYYTTVQGTTGPFQVSTREYESCMDGYLADAEVWTRKGFSRESLTAFGCNQIAWQFYRAGDRVKAREFAIKGCSIDLKGCGWAFDWLNEASVAFDAKDTEVILARGLEGCGLDKWSKLFDHYLDDTGWVCGTAAQALERQEGKSKRVASLYLRGCQKGSDFACSRVTAVSEEEKNGWIEKARDEEVERVEIANAEIRRREAEEDRSFDSMMRVLETAAAVTSQYERRVINRQTAAAINNDSNGGASVAPACSSCVNSCQAEKRACEGGSQSGCYRAAACQCECQMRNGGCGATMASLQQCVSENSKNAAAIARSPSEYRFDADNIKRGSDGGGEVVVPEGQGRSRPSCYMCVLPGK